MTVLTNGWLHAAPLRKCIINVVNIFNSRLLDESCPPRVFSFFIKMGLNMILAKQNL